MEYKTKQRDLVIDILKKNKDYALPAKDIKEKLGNEVSKATLYRTLDKLEDEAIVRKYYNEFTSNYEYQFADKEVDCADHLHLKCSKCGRLIHLHCKNSSDFLSHIIREHNFYINQGSTIVYGICSDCSIVKRG